MSWIKKSLSCFHCHKSNKCECRKKNGSAKSFINDDGVRTNESEVSDKNIQCNFDEEFNGKLVESLVCDKGQ